jgi:hypothetical protein
VNQTTPKIAKKEKAFDNRLKDSDFATIKGLLFSSC